MDVVLMAVILVALYAVWRARDQLEALHRAHLDSVAQRADGSPFANQHPGSAYVHHRASDDRVQAAAAALDEDPCADVDATAAFAPDVDPIGARWRRRWRGYQAAQPWHRDDGMLYGDDRYPRAMDSDAIDAAYGTSLAGRRTIDPCTDPFATEMHGYPCRAWSTSDGHAQDWHGSSASDWSDRAWGHGFGSRWDDGRPTHDHFGSSDPSSFDR